MSLCIVGKESLDEMESYLGTLGFDAIENKNVKPKEWHENPYGDEQLRKRVEVRSLLSLCNTAHWSSV